MTIVRPIPHVPPHSDRCHRYSPHAAQGQTSKHNESGSCKRPPAAHFSSRLPALFPSRTCSRISVPAFRVPASGPRCLQATRRARSASTSNYPSMRSPRSTPHSSARASTSDARLTPPLPPSAPAHTLPPPATAISAWTSVLSPPSTTSASSSTPSQPDIDGPRARTGSTVAQCTTTWLPPRSFTAYIARSQLIISWSQLRSLVLSPATPKLALTLASRCSIIG